MTTLEHPVEHECLVCFLHRMLGKYGCDGSFRLLKYYRDNAVPRASALERKMMAQGAICDCEVQLNVADAQDAEAEEALEFDEDLICHGTRRGSVQPCDRWAMRRGVQWGGGRFVRGKSA